MLTLYSTRRINFGAQQVKDKVVAPVLAGEKYIALAISEAFAGSDVAGLRTTATKTEDGKFWRVRGTKVKLSPTCPPTILLRPNLQKWITGGNFADYVCCHFVFRKSQGLKLRHSSPSAVEPAKTN